MKVGLVVPGGVDRSGRRRVIPCLLWLIERLARRHEVHVFALRQEARPARYELLGATVHAAGRRWARLWTLAALRAEQRRAPFDILHAFWGGAPGVVAVTAGKWFGRPVLLHLAGGELVALSDVRYGGRLSWRGRLWSRLALRGAARVTAASGPMREAAATLGVTAEELPLGVDLARWPVREPVPRDPTRPARLLHVASLNPVKDQETLLLAAATLARDGAPFQLDILGEDTLGGAVQAKARALGVAGRVTFHGFLPHEELYPLVAGAHLLLVSSRHEAGPVVVLEAAVAGVPTVGTAVGHIRDWAPDAAVAVPVRNAQALAREAAALLADEPRRLRIARAAQQRAVAQDADWTARRVLALYDDLARGRESGRG